jgi:hypothetical protein
VFRRLMGVAAVTVTAGLAVAGCAPVKFGAAAIVGSQRITVAHLTTEAGLLAAAAKNYPGVVTLTSQEVTQETLSWLIRFQINDQIASRDGISISATESANALNAIYQSEKASAAQEGIANITLTEILVANGIAPNLQNELGRYQAINSAFLTAANGGSLPTSATSPANTQLVTAECLAAKSLTIKVNPQFGVMNYAKYEVVTGPNTVSRPSGTAQTASISGLKPAC